jgi:hypothetical protein
VYTSSTTFFCTVVVYHLELGPNMALTPEGMYSICTILTVLATVAVIARMRVRVRQKAKLLMDDWTAVGGLVRIEQNPNSVQSSS